jgi:hypothetical protein
MKPLLPSLLFFALVVKGAPVKHYKLAAVPKQASLLTQRVVALQTPQTVTLTANLEATNEIQFTTDLSTGEWITVATFTWPSFVTNMPAAGPVGFFRLQSTWSVNGYFGFYSVTNQ